MNYKMLPNGITHYECVSGKFEFDNSYLFESDTVFELK